MKVAIIIIMSENYYVNDSGERHILIEMSMLDGWIDLVIDKIMGFIRTPVVRICGLEKLQIITFHELSEPCTII